MKAIGAGLSDVGRQREHNEDRFVMLPEHSLFIVADGMGGHRAGDVASTLATEEVAEFFKTTVNDDITWPFPFDAAKSEANLPFKKAGESFAQIMDGVWKKK